jgi:hypothetical protein
VVAHLRQAALTFGFKLSRRPSTLWNTYQVFPLLCLRQILAERTIPYIDNVTPLRQLLEQRPGIALPERFVLANVRRNFTLHESAHCVAAHVLSGLSDKGAASRPEQQVLLSLLGEAFANTSELIGATFARTRHHRLFYLLNSYLEDDASRTVTLRLMLSRYGFSRTVQFVCVSYLFSNLLQDQVPSRSIRLWSQRIFGTCSALERGQHERLFRRAFRMSRPFREESTEMHFRLGGQERHLHRLRARDPNQCVSQLFEPLQTLTDLLEKGPEPRPTASPYQRAV